MSIDSPITVLKGVGEAVAKKFEGFGIRTIADLLDNYPRRYEDYSLLTPVAQLKPGSVTIAVTISQATGRYVRRGMHITEAIASDDSGSVRLVWFNQPYRAAAIRPGQTYYVSGTYALKRQRFSITNPGLELASDFPVNTARILPIYRETKGLTSRHIRAAILQALPLATSLPERLPTWVLDDYDLIPYGQAIAALHAPVSGDQLAAARRRLGFEEVLQLSLASQLNRQANNQQKAAPIPFQTQLARSFVEHLPFELTQNQRQIVWQIYQDLEKSQPMNRMVEGDVGSGKTVVAAMAAVMVLAQGKQVAFMAPTELLARQHADTLYKLLEPLGYAPQINLLVGSQTAAQKTSGREAIAAGKAGLIIGTHALIQDKVDMHNLAFIVIDEQHRFGVEQRKTLMAKAGHMPHVLSLTATPIPRTLALTLYGELDVSVLSEKPVGRQAIITELVSPNSRKQTNAVVDAELAAGRQMFVVCPLITDSTTLDAHSAESVYERLSKKDFKHHRVGLLHGKMKAAEKQAVMERFVGAELDILVATTVIEVGVDVPNASIMLIENPERFGLAQLHQLRGRVGRGSQQSFCYLMLASSDAPSRRLRALETSNDGFKLAELDLQLRGPGAIYGTMQHGALDLRIAQLTDVELIEAAQSAARQFIARGDDLLQYKHLMHHVTRLRAVTNLN